jgi:hypothetical protein
MTFKRVLMVSAVLLALVESLTWSLVALLFWAFREGLFEPAPSDVVAYRTRLAVLVTAMTLLNLIAVVVFIVRSGGYGWWVLAVVQAADAISFVVWLIFNTLTDAYTILILSTGAAIGAATMAVLVAFRYRSERSAG